MTTAAFRRAAGLTAIFSLACLAVSGLTWLAAAGYDLGAAVEPSRFVTAIDRVDLLRASLAFDVAAYVLLVPLIAALWAEHDPVHPARSRMYAAGGLAYSLVGATGAAALLAAWPPLMRAFDVAAGSDRELVRSIFEVFTEVVYRGMWNVVAAAGIGTWLLGTGTLLRPSRPGLGSLGIAAGAAALADAAFVLAGAQGPAKVALGLLGVLGPVWILLVSIGLLGRLGPGTTVTNTGRSPARQEAGQPSALDTREERGTA